MKRIAFIVSDPITAHAAIGDAIRRLSRTYRVAVILNLPPGETLPRMGPRIEVISIPILRNISPLRDFRALAILISLLSRRRFEAIHSVTPKAGLLAMGAGFFARTPIRIHTFTGQVWATRTGFPRWLFKKIDHLIARLSTHVLVDGRSQRDFLISQAVLSSENSAVLANGSIAGVDPDRFHSDSCARKRIREICQIPDHAILFLFLGRLKTDKGIIDLARAFAQIADHQSDVFLMIVGPDEERLAARIEAICASVSPQVRILGHTGVPEDYIAAADVFCLPSYREGFPSVILQAASAGIPSIASDVYGVVDTIEPEKTGLLHPVADVDAIRHVMQRMIDNPEWRAELGSNARERAHRLFSSEIVTSAWLAFYRSVIG